LLNFRLSRYSNPTGYHSFLLTFCKMCKVHIFLKAKDTKQPLKFKEDSQFKAIIHLINRFFLDLFPAIR
jgi:hypothetical protein